MKRIIIAILMSMIGMIGLSYAQNPQTLDFTKSKVTLCKIDTLLIGEMLLGMVKTIDIETDSTTLHIESAMFKTKRPSLHCICLQYHDKKGKLIVRNCDTEEDLTFLEQFNVLLTKTKLTPTK